MRKQITTGSSDLYICFDLYLNQKSTKTRYIMFYLIFCKSLSQGQDVTETPLCCSNCGKEVNSFQTPFDGSVYGQYVDNRIISK